MLTPDEQIEADVFTTVVRNKDLITVVKYWIGLERAFRVTPDEELELPVGIARAQVGMLKHIQAREEKKRRMKPGGWNRVAVTDGEEDEDDE